MALSLLAVSQAHFNNRSHVARALSFLLAALAHFIQTEQVLSQIDGTLPSVEANSEKVSGSLTLEDNCQQQRFTLKKSWL